MKRYEIEARLKFASCFNSGYNFEVIGKNKADAIKRARREIGNQQNRCHTGLALCRRAGRWRSYELVASCSTSWPT